MEQVSLDFETRSSADIRKTGAYRYAEDPNTEVLVVALSVDGGPVVSWDIRQPVRNSQALLILKEAINKGAEIHAFNSQFEWAILKYVCPRQFDFPIPDINTMRCTAAVCRSAGLPPSLARSAEFLKLDTQKDKMGKALIQKFSVPQKPTVKDGVMKDAERYEDVGSHQFLRIDDTEHAFTVGGEKHTASTAFQHFVDYCVRDVETEMAVAEAMSCFKLKGMMLDAFLADARMNDRGVPVDVTALEKASKFITAHRLSLSKRFKEITGVAPSQQAKSLQWFRDHGYRGKKLSKEVRNLESNVSGMDDLAKEAMGIYSKVSYVAVKKIPAMLNQVMADGKIRGSFLWYGAQKTGRWTSKGVQWQNMKKPSKALRAAIEKAYQDIRAGLEPDDIAFLYGEPYEVVASLSRYFVRFPDSNIYDLDFSSVEARILPMLIGAQRILDKFLGDEDIYVTLGKRLGIDRDLAKACTLATQFQGGWRAVFTSTGSSWQQKRCEQTVKAVREENPEFAEAWKLFQNRFVRAMRYPNKRHEVTRYVSFKFCTGKPFPRMLMRLPSGRSIVYPYPKITPITMVKNGNKWERTMGHLTSEEAAKALFLEEVESSFHSHELSFHGHVKGVTYGRVQTYGGDLLQSATQATGVDLLTHGVIEAERRSFEPFFVVHDQCLTPAEGDIQDLTEALCDVPEWFLNFPLEADGEEALSYSKS